MKIQNGVSLLPPAAEAKASKLDGQLREAAQMYENHFLNQMVKAMRSTVNHEDGLVKQNFAEKIFSEQLDNKYVDGWTQKGGVGLADMIYTQIKEQYFNTKQKNLPQQQNHMLPIAPKKEAIGISPAESIKMKALPPPAEGKMSFRFEVQDPSGGEFEVQAPLPGKVAHVERLDQGWNLVKLDHGQGLKSEMTFPGRVADSVTGKTVESGQKLGILDTGRPVLAWNLDWV